MKSSFASRILTALVILGMFLSLQLTGGTAQAAPQPVRYDRWTAVGNFSSTDAGGCMATNMAIGGYKTIAEGGGSHTINLTGYINISTFDLCSGTQVSRMIGFFSLAPGEFTITPSLNQASMNASFSFLDLYSRTQVPVEVHLNWTGTNEITRSNSSTHYFWYWANKYLNTQLSTFVIAGSSGSVVVNGKSVAPEPSYFAWFRNDKSAGVQLSPKSTLAQTADGSSLLSLPALSSSLSPGTRSISSGGYAYAYASHDQNCISKAADVTVSEKTIKESGAPNEQPDVSLYLTEYDFCNNEYLSLVYANVTPDPGELSFSPSYASATLNTTVVVEDFFAGESYPVEIHLTWTGTGERNSTRYREIVMGPGFKAHIMGHIQYQQSQISGSITAKGMDYLASPDTTYSEIGTSYEASRWHSR